MVPRGFPGGDEERKEGRKEGRGVLQL